MEIATIFESKVVIISAHNTIIRKFANFVRLYFPTHYNIFQPNFGILLLSKGSFREFRCYCLDQKLVYNGNCPLLNPKLKRFGRSSLTFSELIEGYIL